MSDPESAYYMSALRVMSDLEQPRLILRDACHAFENADCSIDAFLDEIEAQGHTLILVRR